MAETLRASQLGLEKVERIIKQKGWGRQSAVWYDRANVSLATLRRFWQRKPISAPAFKAICEVASIAWEDVAYHAPTELEKEIESSEANVWVGRSQLLAALTQRTKQGCRLLLITGITGIGKTALVGQLCDQLREQYSNQKSVCLDSDKHTSFGQTAAYLTGLTLSPSMMESQKADVVKSVVNHLVNQPNLLVLDGLEAILEGNEETGWSTFQDPLWKQFFQKLLAAQSCKCLVIVASQEFPKELREVGSRYSQHWYCKALKGLVPEEQMLLFQRLGLDNRYEAILRRIGKAYEGHPLALQVIAGEILSDPFSGNVMAYWNTYGHEIEVLEQVSQASSNEAEDDAMRLDCYTRHLRQIVRERIETTFTRLQQGVPAAYWLLCLSSVYRRPVVASFWLNMIAPLHLDVEQQWLMLDALRDRYLVEDLILNEQLHLRQHNLIRSVALSHLRQLRGNSNDGPANPAIS
ncbi:MAG TPA: NACHT domain-containing protein [Leptolyngbyaceae cyanobacterium]